MPNTIDAFFNTMSQAISEANEVLKPQASFIMGDNGMPPIYHEISTEPASQFDSVKLMVPNSSITVRDGLTQSMVYHDLNQLKTTLTYDYMPMCGFKIEPLNRLQTANPTKFRALYVDEAMTAVLRAANAFITSKIITGAGGYTLAGNITGAANAGVSLGDFIDMNGVLAARDVPVDNAGDLWFAANSQTYTALQKSPDWREASKVGESRGAFTLRTGVLPLTMNALPVRENQMPSSVVSTTRTSTSFYFHRYAMAAMFAPLAPPPDSIDYRYEMFGPLPVLIVIGYDQEAAGLKLTFHGLMTAKPWRTTHGVIHTGTLAA